MLSQLIPVLLLATPLMATTDMSMTPTMIPTVTAASQYSSILATGTSVQADINSYPLCAQTCNSEVLRMVAATNASVSNPNDIQELCGPKIRAATSGCQAATCNSEDQQKTNTLSEALCGPLYKINATLSSSVSSAIASATAAAIAATGGKDAMNVANYPACAQKCITPNNFQGCGSLSNLQCICNGVPFNQASGSCEQATCSKADLQTITFLAEKLCAPVGGILNSTASSGSSSPTGTVNGSTTVPFTGGAGVGARASGMRELAALGLVLVLGVFAL